MGVEVRKVDKGPCRCFLVPIGERTEPICFTKGVIGSLDDEQMRAYCTPASFRPENQGGIAIDMSHPDPREREKVQNLIRTMKQFSEGVADAKIEYQAVPRAEKRRDIEEWRERYVAPHVHAVARERRRPTPVEQIIEESKTRPPKPQLAHRRPRRKKEKVQPPKSVIKAKAAMAEALGKDVERYKRQLEG